MPDQSMRTMLANLEQQEVALEAQQVAVADALRHVEVSLRNFILFACLGVTNVS